MTYAQYDVIEIAPGRTGGVPTARAPAPSQRVNQVMYIDWYGRHGGRNNDDR
jgi:hypothetical protein